MNAQKRLTTSAPNPVIDSGIAAGGTGELSFSHAVQAVATARRKQYGGEDHPDD